MSQRSIQSAKSTRRSSLDRAIVASIAAMVGMNLFVLSQQLQAAPQVADAHPAAGQSAGAIRA